MAPKYEDISWQDLPGNKFSVSLKPAMPTEQGHIAMQKVRQAYKDAAMCKVHYDREYVIEWLMSKLVKPLSIHGKEEVINLVSEAWENYFIQEMGQQVSGHSETII